MQMSGKPREEIRSIADLLNRLRGRRVVGDVRWYRGQRDSNWGLTAAVFRQQRGAVPVEDEEPNRPAYIQASGSVVGVRLEVNHDLMRGSGIAVNRWLTWYLGLRTVPSLRRF